MKFIDYLNNCLKDKEFRQYWEEESTDLEELPESNESLDTCPTLNIEEAISLLTEEDLEGIVSNRGIHPDTDNKIRTEVLFMALDGDCPVENFLNDITDKKLRAKTIKNIYQLAMEGETARMPLSRYIDDGIYELRSVQSSNITRIFYFFVVGNKIIMTNGYVKKSQELNKKEFEKAKKLMKVYMRQFK